MTINAEGGMSAVTRFAYAILLAKMGEKMAKNGHFRPKNASISLKVGNNVPWGSLKNNMKPLFGFLPFSHFYWA